MKKIIRVFPSKTSMTPDDNLAYFGYPDIFAFQEEPDEVHISVTFTWDIPKAEELFYEWERLGVPVEVGGPAFDDRMGDFTPGMYVKRGYGFTSRGCTKDCWFCSVPRCAHGIIRELPIVDCWNIMDDNILGTSEHHFRAVCEMLKRQDRKPVFSGGLEPAFLQQWQADLMKEINTERLYTAYDTKDDLEPLREMGKKLQIAGFTPRHHMRCYVLCGYPEDSFEEAEKRMKDTMKAGFMPFAMVYRDETGTKPAEWIEFQREWCNAFIVGKKFGQYLKEGKYDHSDI